MWNTRAWLLEAKRKFIFSASFQYPETQPQLVGHGNSSRSSHTSLWIAYTRTHKQIAGWLAGWLNDWERPNSPNFHSKTQLLLYFYCLLGIRLSVYVSGREREGNWLYISSLLCCYCCYCYHSLIYFLWPPFSFSPHYRLVSCFKWLFNLLGREVKRDGNFSTLNCELVLDAAAAAACLCWLSPLFYFLLWLFKRFTITWEGERRRRLLLHCCSEYQQIEEITRQQYHIVL